MTKFYKSPLVAVAISTQGVIHYGGYTTTGGVYVTGSRDEAYTFHYRQHAERLAERINEDYKLNPDKYPRGLSDFSVI